VLASIWSKSMIVHPSSPLFLRATCALLCLLGLSTSAALSHAECVGPVGDLDRNGTVNVVDVQCSTVSSLWALSGNGTSQPACLGDTLEAVDANCVPPFNISDILLVVQSALGGKLPGALDLNVNGCPDTCEAEGCGNSIIDAGEQCDDGNTTSGDGCSDTCVAEAAAVAFLGPGYIFPSTCVANDACPNTAACLSGLCTRTWGTEDDRKVLIEAIGIEAAGQTARICSSGPVLGAPCATGGYVEVASAPLAAGAFLIDLSTLPEGNHTLIAEVQPAPLADTWVTSLGNPTIAFRSRRVFVDLTPPVLLELAAASDTLPPQGVLNASEQASPRTFVFSVASTEGGTAELSAEGTSKALVALNNGAAQALVGFVSDGAKTVQAIAYDVARNPSNPVSLPVVVQSTPPTLQFVKPTGSPLGLSSSLDVALSTEPGLLVSLFDNGLPRGQVVASSSGDALFVGAATEGTHQFVATAIDSALNQAVAFTTPPVVVVDRTPPSLTLSSPAPGTLVAADDASPAAGFQVSVQALTSGAANYAILLASGCDAGFGGCGSPATVSGGSLSAQGGIAEFVTLPLVSSLRYVLTVQIVDSAGNSASSSVELELLSEECIVSLTGIPNSGVFNASSCPAPGCSEVPVLVGANPSAGCAIADSYELRIDGAPVAVQPPGFEGFPLDLSHDAPAIVEIVALAQGAQVGTSGPVVLRADLVPPTVAFVSTVVAGASTPASGSTIVWGLADDLDGKTAGLQRHLRLEASDSGSPSGTLVSLERVDGGTAQPIAGVVTAQPILAWPFGATYLFVTLQHADGGEVRATVRDEAGNESTTSFSLNVDLVAPSAIVLAPVEPQAVHPRLPAIPLEWAAPADDGLGAASYEVRYSRAPITNDADFEAACPASDIAAALPMPAAGAPGTVESYLLAGPDTRPASTTTSGALCKFAPLVGGGTYWVAVRARDGAGNASVIGPSSVVTTDAAALRYAYFDPNLAVANPSNLHRNVFSVGDIDGDGLGDFAFGGRNSHGFCVVRGVAGDPLTDLDLDTLSSDRHHCWFDATPSGLGSPVVALGDVNGDGIDDFGAGAGGLGAPATPEQLRVWLGATSWPPADAPTLVIRGMASGIIWGTTAAGGGNFNGDTRADTGLPLEDIAIGSRQENAAFVIPGQAVWPAATLNLADPAERAAFGVSRFSVADAPSDATFGFRVAFVGEVLPGSGAPCHDLAVAQSKGEGQVYVIAGQQTAADRVFTQSQGAGSPDNAVTIRLVQETDSQKSAFGAGLAAADLDGDGLSEVIVNHPTNARVHIFRGSAMNIATGSNMRILAAGSALYDGVRLGVNGTLLEGAFENVAPAGNFDGDSIVPGGTVDLVYGRFDLFLTTYGELWLRLNAGLDGLGGDLGLLPWQDLEITDPTPGGLAVDFAPTLAPIGDTNGDGFPDLVAGTTGSGYLLVIY
jgi:cysteine-rich repeat protein